MYLSLENLWFLLNFFKEVLYAHEGCMYLIKNSNIVKYY